MNLDKPRGRRLCFLAIGHFPPSVWQLQGERRFFAHVSCPGCTSNMQEENRVVFLLGHSDKWPLCEAISEYLRLSRRVGETEVAAQLKAEAIGHQQAQDFVAAERKMRLALRALTDRS